jgi:hypothetical protein
MLLALIALLDAVSSPAIRAELPVLAVDAIYPPVLSTAQASPLKVIAGRFTQDIESLVFSHPLIRATLDEAPPLPLDSVPQKQYGNFTVSVDPSVPEGFYEVWGVGRYGVSNPRSLLIVHAPIQPLPVGTDPANPPEAQPGVCYYGQMKRNDRHSTRIQSPGRWPRLSLVAAGIDSLAIPTWTLTDDQGQLIHQARSVAGQSLQWPALLSIPEGQSTNEQPPAVPKELPKELPNQFTVKLYDFLFRGGENFAFVLMVDPPENHPVLQRSPWIPPTAVVLDGLAEWPHAQPSSEPPTPLMPSPPWQTSVLIQPNAPPPALEFTPVENQAYELEVLSQVHDPSSDVRVVVDRPPPPPTPQQWSEMQLAIQSPTTSPPIDPAIQQRHDQYRARESLLGREVVAIAEEGPISGTRGLRFASADPLLIIPGGTASKNVRLTLFDLQLLDAKAQPTRAIVRVGPVVPRFHAIGHWTPDTNNPATARTTGSQIARGGSCSMHISVRRAGGMAAPITVSVENLPPGLSAPPVVLAPTQTEAELVFYAEENASSWTGAVTPIARAAASDASLPPSNSPPEWTVPVRAATIHMGASGDRGLPQSRCSSQFLLKIVEQDVAPIQIRAGDGNAIQIPQGGSIPIPIRAVRRAGGEAKCILRPQNIPPKVTLGEFELAPNVNEVNPELKAAADAPLGESTIWFQVETTLKQALHPESHSRTIAYRDRLQSMLADPSWMGDRPALEKIIAETNTRIEALAKEIAPRDFPTFLTTASLRIRVVAPPEPPK